MNYLVLIIVIPILIAVIYFLSWMFGSSFRKWNEGENYDDRKMDKGSSLTKTILIGFVIVVIIGWFFSHFG